MPDISLTQEQIALVEHPHKKIFLEGPAGAGKTTAAVERLLEMLAAGVRADSILLIVPQRTLAEPYYAALRQPGLAAGGMVTVLTMGGLARRMVDLYWPLIIDVAGFAAAGAATAAPAKKDSLPTFLTLETAQYYMAHLVKPLLEQGLFDSVSIERNRLYSQILDNLNKAAVVGFPHTEIGERLTDAWSGEPGQVSVYKDVQTCVDLFRKFCLANNLLDFSLQVEVFRRHLWPDAAVRGYLFDTYQNLLVDNIEEDTPFAHDMVREWLPECNSALLIYDWQAGYRQFLGAHPNGAYALQEFCSPPPVVFEKSLVSSESVGALSIHLASALKMPPPDRSMEGLPESDDLLPSLAGIPDGGAVGLSPLEALVFEPHRYYPQMLDWVVDQIAWLVFEQGVPLSEIVILAPYFSDALRFSLTNRLEQRDILARSHRPSRALRDEPVTRCLLTLAELAHPEWRVQPGKTDVVFALMQAIEGFDLVRAQLLTDIVYRVQDGVLNLTSFGAIRPEVQERVTYLLGERYEILREWLLEAAEKGDEFDHFLSRLFGELLSQPGYGLFANYAAGDISANLIESVQKFRWVAGATLEAEGVPLGQEYLNMVRDGVIAAQYIRSWHTQRQEAVLLAPAYTFLMSNRPVEVQFWLDVGSRGWFERLYQPLTHPYVLSPDWPRDRLWGDVDEVRSSRRALYRLSIGLLRRCRQTIYLGLSELGEQGYEQRGPLLKAFQRLLRDLQREAGDQSGD